jgi:glycosyltransferase involved in cell wall biosynthesis
MRPILHFLQTWLPRSEQFVHAAVERSRYRSIVVSRTATQNRDTFPFRPVYSFGWFLPPPRHPTALERKGLTLSLAALCKAHRVRLVHAHHGYRLRDVRGLVRNLRLPLVVSLYGQDVTTHALAWPGDMIDTLPLAAAVIVPSRFLAARVIEDLGVPQDRIKVIAAAGVDVSWYTPTPLPHGAPEALWIGRFVPKKGVDILLEAWREVRERVPGARLRLLGLPGGPLEALARSAGGDVIVEYTDPGRRAEHVRESIRAARVVVSPSRTAPDGDAESLLLVNLEAQASGRPVVTTRHGGIPEYVDDGTTALVVEEADAPSLADALIRVLTDDELAGRMAAAGPGWARRFSREACVAQTDDLYPPEGS